MGWITELARSVAGGRAASGDEARALIDARDLGELARAANWLTRSLHGRRVDVEELGNIRKNGCTEDCSFCAQSMLYDTQIGSYELPPADEVVAQARRARRDGAASYCLVAAWRQPPADDFERVCGMIARVRAEAGIDVDCSLGFLTAAQASRLAALGVKRYNHNLETARSKFAEICTTHSYEDRVRTLEVARAAGLELCTGGIIGMGETRGQRLELALEIARVAPEEVTINILNPVRGTPLELCAPLPSGEVVRMFALMRFLAPRALIRVSGGREAALEDGGAQVLLSGANAIITAGYLTTGGNEAGKDASMIRQIGLEA